MKPRYVAVEANSSIENLSHEDRHSAIEDGKKLYRAGFREVRVWKLIASITGPEPELEMIDDEL